MNKDLKALIQQTRPFRSLEEEAYLALRLTAQLMDEPWIRFLRHKEDISPSQYNLLRILRGAGDEGRTMSEIADRMINRDPDVTRLADRLVTRGLARRDRDAEDRRVVTLRIADAGLEMLERLDASVDVFMRQILGVHSRKRLRELVDLLGEVRAGFRPFPPEGDSG